MIVLLIASALMVSTACSQICNDSNSKATPSKVLTAQFWGWGDSNSSDDADERAREAEDRARKARNDQARADWEAKKAQEQAQEDQQRAQEAEDRAHDAEERNQDSGW
jgi:hypothetical protein